MVTTSRWVESNHLPSLYQSDALTTRATTGKRRVQESNLLGCDPVGGLAGRSLTGRPTLQLSRRALYGIRTRDLLLDGEASTPLDRQDLRTRRGVRTPNLRLLTTAPLPVGLPGHCSGAGPGAFRGRTPGAFRGVPPERGQPRYRTELALLARQCCTPVRRP